MNLDELLTISEIEEKLKVNGSTIRRWIQQGKIRAYRFGRNYRIPKTEFERFFEQSLVNTDRDINGNEEQSKKRRFSLKGIAKGGQPITKEDIDEVIQEWNKIGSQ